MTENKILTELTPEQEVLVPVYQEKWRKIALSTERINREKAAYAIKAAYALINLPEPELLFYDSPYAAAQTIISHHFGNPLSKQLKSQLRKPVWQLRKQLNLGIYQQLDAQFNQLYKQILREKLELSRQLQWQLEKNLIRQIRSKIVNCIKPEEWVFTGSLLDFCIAVLRCTNNHINWEVFQLIVKHCGWIYPFKLTCVVCERPSKLSFYKQTRHHAQGKPAIEYADGFAMYPNYSRGLKQIIY